MTPPACKPAEPKALACHPSCKALDKLHFTILRNAPSIKATRTTFEPAMSTVLHGHAQYQPEVRCALEAGQGQHLVLDEQRTLLVRCRSQDGSPRWSRNLSGAPRAAPCTVQAPGPPPACPPAALRSAGQAEREQRLSNKLGRQLAHAAGEAPVSSTCASFRCRAESFEDAAVASFDTSSLTWLSSCDDVAAH
jgi:hypothetical protein